MPEVPPPPPSVPQRAPTALRRFDSLVLFIFTVGIALTSLPDRRGFPIADAVEYLRNAGRVETGLPMEQDSVRPFFFSGVLVPIFRLARVFGSNDGREVIAIVSAIMITVAGLAAVLTYRLTSRVAGAPAGLGAALFLAANRVFQFWAPTVTTDVPCALCIGASAALALRPPTARNALLTGGFLGVAALFKYQALLPGGILMVSLPFLWRRPCQGKLFRYLSLVVFGICLGLTLQASLDAFGGRGFGSTFALYFRDNVIVPWVGRALPYLERIFGKESVEDWWTWMFGWKYQVEVRERFKAIAPEMMLTQPYNYYFKEILQLLTPFELVLFGVGVAVLAWKRPYGWWMPLVVLAGSITVLTVKATKDFRLWIPIAPFLFCVIGTGFAAAIGAVAARSRALATGLALASLLPNLVSILGGIPLQTRMARIPSIRPFLAYDARSPVPVKTGLEFVYVPKGWRPWQFIPECKNPADLGGYERAARWLNLNAHAGARVSATWFWQFHFRLRPDLFLAQPPFQIDTYRTLDTDRRLRLRDHLLSLDYFATHLQALILSPEFFDLVEREFETVATLENPMFDESLNTIYIFRRRTEPARAGWFVDLREGAEAEAILEASPASRRLLFVNDNKEPVVELIDCTFDPSELANGNMCAVFFWRVPEGTVSSGRDVHLQMRVRNALRQVTELRAGYTIGFGRIGPERWKPGLVVVQRIPIRPPRDLFDFTRPSMPNEAVSLSLWLQLVHAAPGRTVFCSPNIPRFSRWRDSDTNDVFVGGTDLSR